MEEMPRGDDNLEKLSQTGQNWHTTVWYWDRTSNERIYVVR